MNECLKNVKLMVNSQILNSFNKKKVLLNFNHETLLLLRISLEVVPMSDKIFEYNFR